MMIMIGRRRRREDRAFIALPAVVPEGGGSA